ncbi:MAG: HAMP domain-containing sensor histidine kinase [Planctomycetota bacterium]|nr:HAMP domain-containing sensor histidine kinase [Planctomycetota bacterium]
MKAQRRPLLALYALGSVIAITALAVVTVVVLRQQERHARAVAEALHQEDVRTALWRMETRLGSLLAMTTGVAAQTPPAPGTYVCNRIEPGLNSMQQAEAPSAIRQQALIEAADLAFVGCNMQAPQANAPTLSWTNPNQQALDNRGAERSADEFERRGNSNLSQQVAVQGADGQREPGLLVGPLATCWDSSGEELALDFARRIEGPGGASHASYRIEWDELSGLLLAEIADLFPTARLEPIEESGAAKDDRAQRLAAIPARLLVPPPLPATDLPRDHVWALGGAWAALAFALAVGGLALRSSYAWGDRHRRFTHAVTHELRTPLTTFRMYSEMLARGIVPTAKQPEYLATLETESARLARLVDNVLRYSRIEDGRGSVPRTRMVASELVQRCVPELARTCAAHQAQLEVEEPDDGSAVLVTDADAVLQVLSNLVENACKYGRAEGRELAPIRLRVARDAASLRLEVSDEGPGVPKAVECAIFEPFDRGGRDSADRCPGVGLGLALSRALAVELGGTLELVPGARGATFRLTLPLAS